jgi:hypothetical protein
MDKQIRRKIYELLKDRPDMMVDDMVSIVTKEYDISSFRRVVDLMKDRKEVDYLLNPDRIRLTETGRIAFDPFIIKMQNYLIAHWQGVLSSIFIVAGFILAYLEYKKR